MCGDNTLAYRLINELITRYGAEVTVVMRARNRGRGPQIADLDGVRIVEAAETDDDALREAGIATARGLALVGQDDVGNIHTSLRAYDLNPRLRLVVRIFNLSLGHRVRAMLDDCVVLSDSAMAAPTFVASALGELAPSYVRLSGRTLYQTRRSDVSPRSIVCGLADTSGPAPRMLPADQANADLVLAIADGTARDPFQRPAQHRWSRHWRRARVLLSNRLAQTAVVLIALMLIGMILQAALTGYYGWWKSIYMTIMDAAGAAQPDTEAPLPIIIVQVLLTLLSITIVPVVTAAVVDALVRARLARAGRVPEFITDHVVIVGLGEVGARVMRQLRDLGVTVVGVDRDESARGVRVAGELGLPVVVGDATQSTTLKQASVATCRSVLLLTSSDAVNLEAALLAKGAREDIRVVLRLFDSDLAERVERIFGVNASHSVSYLAASAFAAAMVEQRVVDTIAIGRHVLMIAEVPIRAGAPLVGPRLRAAHEDGDIRVIGLQRQGTSRVQWSPDPDYRLAVQDRLTVLATRAGLALILGNSTPPVEQPDAG